jgi:hypothetical protein
MYFIQHLERKIEMELNSIIIKQSNLIFKTLNWIEVSELDKRIMDFIQKKTGTIIPNYPEASLINRDYFSEIDFINDEFRVYDIHNNIIENRRNIIYNEVNKRVFCCF